MSRSDVDLGLELLERAKRSVLPEALALVVERMAEEPGAWCVVVTNALGPLLAVPIRRTRLAMSYSADGQHVIGQAILTHVAPHGQCLVVVATADATQLHKVALPAASTERGAG